MACMGQCREKGVVLPSCFSGRLQGLLYQQRCDTLMSEQLQEQVLLLGALVKAKELVLSPGWNRQWSVQEAHLC